MLKVYSGIIEEQLECGFIEEVPDSELSKPCHYIPHHGVHKDSTTTPLRIVYDCSSREAKHLASLNDCLEKGPPSSNNSLLFSSVSVPISLESVPTLRRHFYMYGYITRTVISLASSGHPALVIPRVHFKPTVSELFCLVQPVPRSCCTRHSTAI